MQSRIAESIHPRSPLKQLRAKIVADLWLVKHSGQTERYAALVDVLKEIAKLGVPK